MHHILVIDDESSIRRALKDIFEYEGFHFSEAADGKAGLKLLKEDEIEADIDLKNEFLNKWYLQTSTKNLMQNFYLT